MTTFQPFGRHVKARILAVGLTVLACWLVGSCTRAAAPKPDTSYGRGGEHLWLPVAWGRLKAEAYLSAQISAHPVLLNEARADREAVQ